MLPLSKRSPHDGGNNRSDSRAVRGHQQRAAFAHALPHAEPDPGHGTHHRHRPDAHGDRGGHVPQAWTAPDTRHAQRVSHISLREF